MILTSELAVNIICSVSIRMHGTAVVWSEVVLEDICCDVSFVHSRVEAAQAQYINLSYYMRL